jgi:hypothetical protein
MSSRALLNLGLRHGFSGQRIARERSVQLDRINRNYLAEPREGFVPSRHPGNLSHVAVRR